MIAKGNRIDPQLLGQIENGVGGVSTGYHGFNLEVRSNDLGGHGCQVLSNRFDLLGGKLLAGLAQGQLVSVDEVLGDMHQCHSPVCRSGFLGGSQSQLGLGGAVQGDKNVLETGALHARSIFVGAFSFLLFVAALFQLSGPPKHP